MAVKVQFYLKKKKNQEIMAALQYKPQQQWKMGKKKYKPRLIMARVRYFDYIQADL